jgi:phosphatidylinositol glycan class V
VTFIFGTGSWIQEAFQLLPFQSTTLTLKDNKAGCGSVDLLMLSDVQQKILYWTAIHRGLTIAVLFFSAIILSPFDSSPWIQLRLDATSSPLSTLFALPLLRWDSLHFLAMASPRSLPLPASISYAGQLPSQAGGGGIHLEQSLAFQPGIVWLLRLLGSRGNDVMTWNPTQALYMTSLVATMLSILSPVLLYR